MELNKPLTLGSLFDGSGGFPLGGLISGITPVWASEVEPFPIRVTTKRMPFVKHYGDVSKMHGGNIEPVDIITFGSPCQDMSVAGKRAGLDGSRSNLFYEAIRIVKEMRCATGGKQPRYIVWENVPGAFSSNKGQDFRSVLEAVCSVKDPDPLIPEPQKGRWDYAGSIVADDYSVAWRTLDAQFWGVPQRRRRIYLVADFAGGSAEQILFESEGLSGYTPQGFRSWQGTAEGAEAGTDAAGFDGYNGSIGNKAATLGVNCGMSTGRNGVVLNDQGGNRMDVTNEVTATLRAEARHPPCVMESAGFCTEHSAKARSIGYEAERSPTLRAGVTPAAIALENHPADSRVSLSEDGTVQTLTSRMGTGGNNVPLLLKIRSGCEGGGKGALIQEDKSATLSCNNDQTLFQPMVAPKSQQTFGREDEQRNERAFAACGETRDMELVRTSAWDGSQVSPTLTKQNASGSQRMPDKDNFNCVVEAYGVCSKASHSMLSDNPHSGFYKADTTRTLDGNGGNPTCNQGGIAIVEGNGARPSHQGPGFAQSDVMYTLNTVDRHGVAYAMTTGSFTQVSEGKSPTLMARDYKDPTAVAYGIGRDALNQGKNAQFAPSVAEELQPTLVAKGPGAVAEASPEYTVRRLTPTECARLQGFPDWWCSDLGTDNPSYGEIDYWTDVFETHRRVMDSSSKPKSQKQIIKWLKDPYSDAAEYKMWGNGVALPCVCFVLAGIVFYANNIDSSDG